MILNLTNYFIEQLIICQKRVSRFSNSKRFSYDGFGKQTLDIMSSNVSGKAIYLDTSFSFAHMDPLTPWLSWFMAFWNAKLNQNLLHKELSSFTTEAEEKVIEWIKEYFGMSGGHMCSSFLQIWRHYGLQRI